MHIHTSTQTYILSIYAQAENPHGYSNFSKLTSKKIIYLFLPYGFSALYNKQETTNDTQTERGSEALIQ